MEVWLQATWFFVANGPALLVVAPFLLVPVVCDGLCTLLIIQNYTGGRVDPATALRQTVQALGSFLRLKLYFWGLGVAWALVPIYGLIRDIDERLAWSMSSNVVFVEGVTDFEAGRQRCRNLVAGFRRPCSRTLIILPGVFIGGAMLLLVTFGHSVFSFWSAFLGLFFILLPGSAAANTFLFLRIRAAEGRPLPEPDRLH